MPARGVIDRDGFRLSWVREGSGIPLLVVGSHRFYARYFPRELRAHFDILFCDSRQWVPTPAGFDLSTLTIKTFADDIEAARQVTGLDNPIVLGQSQHGAIAFEYARFYGDRIRGVGGVAAVPPAQEGLEPPADFFRRDASPERLVAHERNLATRPVPTRVTTGREFAEEYVANDAMNYYDLSVNSAPLWEGVDLNLEVVYQLFGPEGLGGFRLEPLEVPAFLGLGRFDYGVPHYLWDEPRKRLLNLTFKLYQKSGHHPPYEQPDEFTADLYDWAKRL
ncbi:MAG TPA: alpha/beta hydrolase [Mycobacteriales bacterium]|nr:alpha/beta hydrolase [Mycobacteriales bacterium]